jgi:hypothetical protein
MIFPTKRIGNDESRFLALEMMLISINSAWVKALLKEGKTRKIVEKRTVIPA